MTLPSWRDKHSCSHKRCMTEPQWGHDVAVVEGGTTQGHGPICKDRWATGAQVYDVLCERTAMGNPAHAAGRTG